MTINVFISREEAHALHTTTRIDAQLLAENGDTASLKIVADLAKARHRADIDTETAVANFWEDNPTIGFAEGKSRPDYPTVGKAMTRHPYTSIALILAAARFESVYYADAPDDSARGMASNPAARLMDTVEQMNWFENYPLSWRRFDRMTLAHKVKEVSVTIVETTEEAIRLTNAAAAARSL